ncbi:MAG TPA: Plug domain-containing protein, partial [Nevskiaceae bacterium]|nr:Plug domain-containing protein [Nevskiaceae bacterium]
MRSCLAAYVLLLVAPAHAQQQEQGNAPAEVAAEPVADNAAAAPAAAPADTIPVAPLHDDTAAATPATEKEAADAQRLDDVVVTATKRPQSVRKIPMSITALTSEKLEEMGAHEIKDFLQLVPGVNTQDEISGIQRKLSIRGVGPDTSTNQTVGIVLGDVPLSDPYGSYTIVDPDPWDLRTVEVLKGPQGTLFGATSLAGLIRYVPNAPE